MDKPFLIHVDYHTWPSIMYTHKPEWLVYAKDYIAAKAKLDKHLRELVNGHDRKSVNITLTCVTLC